MPENEIVGDIFGWNPYNANDDVDLDPTVFMGEGQLQHGEDDLDEGNYGQEEEEEGDIKCMIGKRRAKVCRDNVNVNGF